MSRPRAVIFDFDGTLADSFVVFVETLEEVLARKESLTHEEIETLRGKNTKEILKYLKIRSWQVPKLIIKGRKAVGLKIVSIKPFKEIPRALSSLHAQGYKIFILSSNSPENIAKFLEVNKIKIPVTKVYGNVGLRKSSALKKLLKKEHLRTGGAVYIGDEVRDIEAAKKAGIRIISAGWGFNHPDALQRAQPTALAKSPKDLPSIINKL